MDGITVSGVMLLLFVIIVPVGLIGVGAFLFVRQSLDRILDRDSDSFESRVLDELEVLRMRLDQISERLDAIPGERLDGSGDGTPRGLDKTPGSLPPSPVGEGKSEGD